MERKHSSQPIDQCQGRQTGQVFVATKVAASLDGCSSHLSLAETKPLQVILPAGLWTV